MIYLSTLNWLDVHWIPIVTRTMLIGSISDTPPNSLKDLNANSKVKITKEEKVGYVL